MDSKVAIGATVVLVIIIGIIVVVMNNNRQPRTGAEKSGMPHSSTEGSSMTKAHSAQEANQIMYKGFAVSPKTLMVKKGTTVTWTNQDDAEHDVTPDAETDEFKASQLFGKGQSHKVTFNTVGTYGYYCSPHPYMKGVIEVVE